MYNWLDLETLGFWLIVPKISPDNVLSQHILDNIHFIHESFQWAQEPNKTLGLNKGCQLFLWTWLEPFSNTSRKLCQKQAQPKTIVVLLTSLICGH